MEESWIQRTISGGYAITAFGVDSLEESGPMTGKDLLLPEPGSAPEKEQAWQAVKTG